MVDVVPALQSPGQFHDIDDLAAIVGVASDFEVTAAKQAVQANECDFHDWISLRRGQQSSDWLEAD
jgi:hypothetical protein